jgi:cobalt-zinc-cadmium resistance protein CzcA
MADCPTGKRIIFSRHNFYGANLTAMLDQLIQFSIRRKLFVGFSTLFLIAGGIYCMLDVPVDAVPDITNNQVQVVTVSPSLSPQEVEQLITSPVEMAMANILNVTEIRSVSRFGLSVVTIVFKDRVPILDARQLVNEQIQVVAQEFPAELGIPQLMPITTGLGEIFQYTLEVEPGYEGKYTATDLRTIQDWIVKRQLSGIPGIVEISSFGGYLKQYEVAADPEKMRSLNVSLREIYDALEGSNQNSGGSYIEKYNNAYYIRSEGMVKSLEDIENIVIRSDGVHPVLIRDVGKVRMGNATRYGAMTKNGKGEAVGGITLMLKGANSSDVISLVKKRIASVQQRLPEGLQIKDYLDRSKLVKNTIHTVTRNLVEGGLIVIFVLVLLLGNFRAGLIVASVIPLSLLFAFIMMRIFGVSANLMSLGAIDFGIVIDGAVIIVEGVIHHLYSHFKGKTLDREEMNGVVLQSTRSIYKSAVFGVFIILIVFLPILSLTGIEGKTFRPMAQTVSFAILGALILSLTYVPMVASTFLQRDIRDKLTFSDRFINLLKRSYRPVLHLALRFRYTVLLLSFLVFGASIWGFLHLGGEFLPQLSEGDLAMQMSLPPGSSLSESIEISTRAEKVLMQNFPEVIQVISKIGTAEVPTDPMAVEDADIMIAMKDQKEWKTASTREEMVNMMEEKLEVVTGASFEFTQPIQLRFNELMTGAKSDIAIKIYGDDMDELFRLANEASSLIQGVEGAVDVKVEKIQGLPQLLIRYNRDKMALYGLRVKELNEVVKMAFAGGVAGTVYEGERKFDLVVRLQENYRKEAKLDQLFVRLANGSLLPLSEIASMEFYNGPMQISRDDTRRRVVIGVNVRGRDVESVVADVERLLSPGLRMPPGYFLSYGGQFENLKRAKERLAIAIPAALMLILLLLFFTFNSIKYALLIFTAVPLSAIGGIAALAIRGMPFSISAGVGFIALFGVAVLNGIVLIGYYNQLRKEGRLGLSDLVEQGALVRLRPVMMTALVASLGFLPMAISTSAGAEVQKPLATVVIGGLITSTLLTMLVLPILYTIFNSELRIFRWRIRFTETLGILLLIGFLSPVRLAAQEPEAKVISLEEVIALGLKNHPDAQNARLATERIRAERLAVFNPGLSSINYQKGQINSAVQDEYLEIQQELGSLLTPFARAAYVKKLITAGKNEEAMSLCRLEGEIKTAWFNWIYTINHARLMEEKMEQAAGFMRVARARFETGEDNLLERTVAETQYAELRMRNNQAQEELVKSENELRMYTGLEGAIVPVSAVLELYAIRPSADSSTRYPGTLVLDYYTSRYELARSNWRVEQSRFFPELSAGYFRQQIDGVAGFEGWQAGVAIPLWFLPRAAATRQARIDMDMAKNTLEFQQRNLQLTVDNLLAELQKLFEEISYYNSHGLVQADLLIKTANLQYEKEDIGYLEYMQAIQAALSIRESYLGAVNRYNQLAVKLEFYTW